MKQNEKTIFTTVPSEIKTNTIKLNRHKSKRWNDLYLHTYHEDDLKNNRITDETIVHLAQKVACIVTRSNYARSCGVDELRVYLDVCRYDPFNGNRYGDNCGGDDLVGEAVLALSIARDMGYTTLSDTMEDGRDVFRFVCAFVNKSINGLRKFGNVLGLDDISAIGRVSDSIEHDSGLSPVDAFTFRYVLEHIALTPIQLRNVEHASWGLGIREIARLEGKSAPTILESLQGVKRKFVKYCKANGIEFDEKALMNILEKE